MEIEGLASALGTATPNTPEPAGSKRTGLGQQDFLRMLITQLEHQDPLEPQDPTEFTAQLAQFSNLEQLVAIREGIDALGGPQAGSGAGDLAALASLVGREVLVRGDRLTVDGSAAPAPIGLELDAPAANVRITLRIPGTDRIVHGFDAGSLGAGRQQIAWNGVRADGTPVPPGVYEVRAESLADGTATRLATLVRGRVDAVAPARGGAAAVLEVGDMRIDAGDVLEVRAAPALPAAGAGTGTSDVATALAAALAGAAPSGTAPPAAGTIGPAGRVLPGAGS